MMRVVCSKCALVASLLFFGYPTVAQSDPIVISSGAIVGHASDSSLLIEYNSPGSRS